MRIEKLMAILFATTALLFSSTIFADEDTPPPCTEENPCEEVVVTASREDLDDFSTCMRDIGSLRTCTDVHGLRPSPPPAPPSPEVYEEEDPKCSLWREIAEAAVAAGGCALYCEKQFPPRKSGGRGLGPLLKIGRELSVASCIASCDAAVSNLSNVTEGETFAFVTEQKRIKAPLLNIIGCILVAMLFWRIGQILLSPDPDYAAMSILLLLTFGVAWSLDFFRAWCLRFVRWIQRKTQSDTGSTN